MNVLAEAELVGLPHFMQFPLPCVTVVSDISVSKLLGSLTVSLQRFLRILFSCVWSHRKSRCCNETMPCTHPNHAGHIMEPACAFIDKNGDNMTYLTWPTPIGILN